MASEKLPATLREAVKSGDPIKALAKLQLLLAEELDTIDMENQAYLLPQLSSQLQACTKLLEEFRAKAKGEGKADGNPASTGQAEQGKPVKRGAAGWADVVGMADHPAAARQRR